MQRQCRSGSWSFVLFTVSVETHFWASHELALPDGSREPPHQHNWAVTAEVSGNELNRMGLVMDFQRLRTMLDSIAGELDNTTIEKIDYFQKNCSSAENLARYIYERLEPKLPKGVKLEVVRVGEERGCSAKFSQDG
ncbi:MAG: 6-carboxytetrahydropterin synthase [Planctomycetota bacterium]|nr:MAG: 6-carboxytetrahydropterin synthase [Planctomycetota bacterium]